MKKSFGSMPLTWTKLGEYNDVADIYLCDQIVAHRRFDTSSNEWNGSELQQWVNGEFYRKAFTKKQRSLIIGNKDTNDNVFLLSRNEYDKFESKITKGEFFWWLRAPGFSTIYATYVDCHGGVYCGGLFAVDDYLGVRPTILLRKEVKQ